MLLAKTLKSIFSILPDFGFVRSSLEWTVLGQSGRGVELDGPCMKLDGPKGSRPSTFAGPFEERPFWLIRTVHFGPDSNSGRPFFAD